MAPNATGESGDRATQQADDNRYYQWRKTVEISANYTLRTIETVMNTHKDNDTAANPDKTIMSDPLSDNYPACFPPISLAHWQRNSDDSRYSLTDTHPQIWKMSTVNETGYHDYITLSRRNTRSMPRFPLWNPTKPFDCCKSRRSFESAASHASTSDNHGLPSYYPCCGIDSDATFSNSHHSVIRHHPKLKMIAAAVAHKSSGVQKFQVVHPVFPNEKEWVMVAGNESAVDSVLAISLLYNGRLASMGHYNDNSGGMHYYAIMHRFIGPVFLKPNPLTFAELLKIAQENEEIDLGLTQLCGQADENGKVLFSTYWEKIPGVSFRIWFPGTVEAKNQKILYENEGYRLTTICGYSVKNEAYYVGVWQKPALNKVPYEAHYGLSLRECLSHDEKLATKDFVATQFRVFSNGNEVLCCAIWEYFPGRKHFIEIGENLRQMHKKHMSVRSRLPRQISHFVDVATNRVKYVVLWSNLSTFRYPNPPDIWAGKSIPAKFLPGTEKQLQPSQLRFLVKRVERFMRELDIPGLSVAISRQEQLKFAAGFGYSNIRRREVVTPYHQFRVGSVSKPITAAAIMLLVERGKLGLDQRVFGSHDSIFGNEFARDRPYGKFITNITIRNLLEHTSGGWNNVDSDPAWLEPELTTPQLIELVLERQPLIARPGQAWIYSNFGYQLLGYIIERLSGQTYEQFVKSNIWDKVGVAETQVARPTLSEKSRREVLYYMSGNKLGFNPYEMLPPERTGPWGGWIASPIELLKLMAHVDGFHRKPDILSERSLREWIVPTAVSNETYGLGWSLNIMGFNGWQHDGRMPGSAAMLVRLDNGLEMAVIVNKEYSERDFFHELGYILHHIGNNCDWWKENRIDLF
ncbi:beta-lactamase domain-containing protein [Ditylenchus destructor]|uniref:Beta-lactamase domain-containing protein n=1 Tax=Ditylenchus destructor TaxID=166010 RepID=A0AAD4NDE6_9BILA|nr:beta-lactamase domain-containing protein [Ditylenchus destructor]